jgi:hypothetical protein
MSTELKLAIIEARPNNLGYGPEDRAYLLALAKEQKAKLDALRDWAGRAKTGYYDEAQDDVTAILYPRPEV